MANRGAETWLASHARGRSARMSQDSIYTGMDRGNEENRSPPSAQRRSSRPTTGPAVRHRCWTFSGSKLCSADTVMSVLRHWTQMCIKSVGHKRCNVNWLAPLLAPDATAGLQPVSHAMVAPVCD